MPVRPAGLYSASMNPPRLLVLSAGMRRIAALPVLLQDFQLEFRKPDAPRPDDIVLAWGQRPSALRAQQYAVRHGLRVLHIEDGFLRSVGLGHDDPPLSVVVDDLGLYLDADHPSRLEQLIPQPLDDRQVLRARSLVAAWRNGRVSKYNHARDAGPGLPEQYVLVIDQTQGDASIVCGRAGCDSFDRMLAAAMDRHPGETILVKMHPDVVSGRKKGHFEPGRLGAYQYVKMLDYDVHPASLLERALAVYTVTSQVGFEALIWGKPVYLFGMPFYGGWGLTHDDQPPPPRRHKATIEQVVYAALVRYSRYVDPETGNGCDAETVLSWLALQRRMRQRFPEHLAAIGFSAWKKPFVREFFGGSKVRFARRGKGAAADGTIATWGRKHDLDLGRYAASAQIIRLEDGFIRSVGLGADLIRPLSWVQDDLGIYYDATAPSRLENLLAQTQFDAALLARAAALRQMILDAGITKYNLAGASWQRPPGDRRVILVVGQVETDASIQYGAAGIRRNIDLLQAVRRARPDAHVVYKPHPDVQAGLRLSGQQEDAAANWCDEIIDDVPFGQLLEQVDEVHVLTSLGGFEALMRGIPVVTYGLPFYAGWGLTRDLHLTEAVKARRPRMLSLDELVAGTLILYPTYVSRGTHRFTTPEHALQELIVWRKAGPAPRMQFWRRWIARLTRKP